MLGLGGTDDVDFKSKSVPPMRRRRELAKQPTRDLDPCGVPKAEPFRARRLEGTTPTPQAAPGVQPAGRVTHIHKWMLWAGRRPTQIRSTPREQRSHLPPLLVIRSRGRVDKKKEVEEVEDYDRGEEKQREWPHPA